MVNRRYEVTSGPYHEEQYADDYDTEEGVLTFYRGTGNARRPVRTFAVGYWDSVQEVAVVVPQHTDKEK